MYLQIRELIRKHFDLVNVVQQFVVFLLLAYEEIETNKKDVGLFFCLLNVAKDLPCLRWSFPTLDVSKLVVRQVEVDDGYSLFDVPLMFLLDLGIRIGSWSFLRSIHNVLKVYGSQNYLHFEFPKAKFLSVEFVHDSSPFILKIYHLTLKNCVCMLKTFKSCLWELKCTIYIFNLCPCSMRVLHHQLEHFGIFMPQFIQITTCCF